MTSSRGSQGIIWNYKESLKLQSITERDIYREPLFAVGFILARDIENTRDNLMFLK